MASYWIIFTRLRLVWIFQSTIFEVMGLPQSTIFEVIGLPQSETLEETQFFQNS